MHKPLLTLFALTFLSSTVLANKEPNAQVTMLGLFHFANPGLDKVKTKQMDISTDDNQAYLTAFTRRVAQEFKPTKVLLECALNEQDKLNQEFKLYQVDQFNLPINGNYQVGFRVARAAKISEVTCYDEREVQ